MRWRTYALIVAIILLCCCGAATAGGDGQEDKSADVSQFRMRSTDLVQRVPALTERNFKSWRLRIVMVLNAMGLAAYLGLAAMADKSDQD